MLKSLSAEIEKEKDHEIEILKLKNREISFNLNEVVANLSEV